MTAQDIVEEYPLNALGFRELPGEMSVAMMLTRLMTAPDKAKGEVMTQFETAHRRGIISDAEWNAIRYFNLAIA